MKARILIIIAGLSIVGIFGVLYVANMIENYEDQKAQEEWREIREDSLSEIKKNKISDPICFVIDRATSGETGSAVTVDDCFTLKQFEGMGCTKPMLEHLNRHSNILDFVTDGTYHLDFIGLPEGMSIEKFEECWDVILEKRHMITSKSKDGSKICPDGKDYNEVLLKCVVSCENDLVYNGYTDSCSTEFELKYHGFCNDGFTYNPSSHVCYSDESQHIPLKDPPRSPPPEPEPTSTLTEVHCFPNQVIYNDECIYVLTPTDEFPEGMTKYFSMVDDKIINFCEIKNATSDRENASSTTLDRCFEISHYTISYVNVIDFQSTTPPTWINIRMENLTRYVELDSSPTFKVIESGWGNPCTHPTLEVYHMKQEIGNDYTVDDLMYKHRIVYSCPWYEAIYPPPEVLRIWDESDFTDFPICETQGRFLIIGDSGHERIALEEYYCGVEDEN